MKHLLTLFLFISSPLLAEMYICEFDEKEELKFKEKYPSYISPHRDVYVMQDWIKYIEIKKISNTDEFNIFLLNNREKFDRKNPRTYKRQKLHKDVCDADAKLCLGTPTHFLKIYKDNIYEYYGDVSSSSKEKHTLSSKGTCKFIK